MDPAAGDPNAMPADPAMDPAAEGDPNAMPAEDPMAGGDMGGAGASADDDSTEGIISQLSDDDKDAVRNYAKSLLKRDETQNNPEEMGMAGMEEPAAAPAPAGGAAPMMEIKKSRLMKFQKRMNEVFRGDEEDDRKEKPSKKVNKRQKGNPFSSFLD